MGGGVISEFVDFDRWSDAAVSVMVCDDAAHWRRQLVVALEGSPGIEVAAELDDGEALVARVGEVSPDVVWLGLPMDGPGAPRLIAAILELSPSSGVVVVANPEDSDLRLRALRAGASAIVARASAPEVATSVTQRLAWGRCTVAPQDLVNILGAYARLGRQAGSVQVQLEPPVLSERDRDVLARLALGAGMDEVAGALELSAVTVDRVLSVALARLQGHARTEAMLHGVGRRPPEAG